MNCSEYKALDESTQIKLLTSKGIYLTERQDHQCHYRLYQLDAFYIEIIVGLTSDCSQKVNVFQNTRFLEPYLDGINIAACL